ncbi:unnamed protein product [Schistocephalus solidus]|uniref:Uncharacterized protein n=1 Tax=Schistocephalus solidus TaxID=70667 RepID=A0A183SJ41_SCHSO|nr:unnamed protein product [Schistocephalus solidus]
MTCADHGEEYHLPHSCHLSYQLRIPARATSSSSSTTTTATDPSISDEESVLAFSQCDLTFNSRIGLFGHFQIRRTEFGEPASGALTHNRDRRIHFPHCPRAFTHRMGLFGRIRIHDSRFNHSVDSTDTPCLSSSLAILTATLTTTNDNPQPLPIFPAHTVPETLPLASAWTVTCESIAVAVPAYTAVTAHAHSPTAWTY